MERLSTAELRKLNRTRVFQTIYDQETPLTKQDIAGLTGMSLPTVSQNLKELFDEGLLHYVGTEKSTGGRKPRLIAIQSAARFAVGAELTPREFRLAAADLRGKELAFRKYSRPFAPTEDYRRFCLGTLEVFLDQLPLPRERLLGVGIALPGIVRRETGVVEMAPVLKLRDVPIGKLLQGLPYAAWVQNDASAGGAAERRLNPRLAGAGAMAYLSLGEGVGGAILLRGGAYEGTSSRSGEFGHMCVAPGGRICSCGQRGCLEAYCSASRLSEDLGISLETFFQELRDGEQAYESLWQSYLEHLAMGVNLINTALDCPVVIGGAVAPYLEPDLEKLCRMVAERSAFGRGKDCVWLGRWGETANCIGGALHFIDQYVQSI